MTALPHRPAPRVVIVGGGLSGAAVAFHLAAQLRPGEAEIDIVEPRADLGRGVAYSTTDPAHRLNVPDNKMSLYSNDPGDFRNWLALPAAPLLPAGSATLRGDIFAPRHIFGRYVADRLKPLQAEDRVRHLQHQALSAVRSEGGYRVGLRDGTFLQADVLVLAMAHAKPRLPAELEDLRNQSVLIDDPLAKGALERIGPKDRVLIIGNGLTSADVVATLARKGQAVSLQTLSRHGLRSKEHGPAQAETNADFAQHPETTALGLLRQIRTALAADAAQGLTWHAVFDRVRAQGPAIWSALPQAERRRVLRHLRSLWDVHRFRIAPQTHATLAALHRSGRLDHLAGRICAVAVTSGVATITVRRKGSRDFSTLEADHIVLATGPDHGAVTVTNAFLADLTRQGLIRPDPLGLGIATMPDGLAEHGPDPSRPPIFVAGPLARGTVGELMGVPEVIIWAEHIAGHVAGLCRNRPPFRVVAA